MVRLLGYLAALGVAIGSTHPVLALALRQPVQAPAARVDRFGDPLPVGALTRLGTIRYRLNFEGLAVGFSRDGKLLAAKDWQGGVRLFDTATGHLIPLPSGAFGSFAFSPDGRTLAIGCNGGILEWDLATRQPGRQYRAVFGLATTLAFSPDGKTLISGGSDHQLHWFDVASAGEIRQVSGHQAPIRAVAISPDGKLVASASEDQTVRLWEAASGNLVHQLQAHPGGAWTVAFSPDGKLLATGGIDGFLRLWDPAAGVLVRSLEKQPGLVMAAAFSPDGKLLVSSGDRVVRLWDPTTGHEVTHWPGHSFRVTGASFSPDGKTLATVAMIDTTIHLWDVATGQPRNPSAGHSGAVWDVAFSPDGQALTARSGDKTFCRWDLRSGLPTASFGGPLLHGPALLSADRTLLAAGGREKDFSVSLYDRTTGKLLHKLGEHPGGVESFAFSPDQTLLASGGNDVMARIWDVRSGRLVRQLDCQPGTCVMALAFTSDGSILATGNTHNSGTVHLWDVPTGRRLRTIYTGAPIQVLRFSPDGKTLVTAAEFGQPQLWETTTGRALQVLSTIQYGARAVTFSPDGQLLALGCEFDPVPIHVVEVATGQEVCQFQGHQNQICSLGFSADGTTLASGGADSTILLWDITGLRKAGKPARAAVAQADLEHQWTELAHASAARAFEIAWSWSAAPHLTIPFLRARLRPAAGISPERLALLLENLDNDSFALREQASRELASLGPPVEGALRLALAHPPSPEVRRRLEYLLHEMRPGRNPDFLRSRRALLVLEHAGTAEARTVLETLTSGVPEANLTYEARAALARLASRPAELR